MPDGHGPLLILARKLRAAGPPSLSIIIARTAEMEDYERFLDLVKEYLPEREREILCQSTPREQMAVFATRFEDRYFPLEPHIRCGDAESYEELTYRIPVIVRGINWEEYDSIASEARDSIQLMTYLIENPYDDNSTHVSLTEACREHVPAAVLQMVPENGFSLVELRKLLDKTPHDGLAAWAAWIHQDTGNDFLDTDYETYGYSIPVEWSREDVEHLTRQWHQANLIEGKVDKIVEWLEVDLAARFRELINFILQRREEVKIGRKRDDGLPVGTAGKP